MKKTLCLFIVALVLVCVHVSALADLGYVTLKLVLNETLGKGFSAEIDELPEESTVLVVFDVDECRMVLFGKNSTNMPEGTMWDLESVEDVLVRFLACCMNWDDFESSMSSGYQLEYLYTVGDTVVSVDSASKAELAVAMFYDSLE